MVPNITSGSSFYGVIAYNKIKVDDGTVTAHGTWLQSHVEPAFALAVYVGTPFFMIFQNPFAQPSFVLVERKTRV